MNILHIIVGLNIGGAELMLKRLIESHRDHPSYRHAVVSLTGLGKLGPALQAAGVSVQALHMRSSLQIPRVLWQLHRMIRRTRPDVVQTWMYHADLLGGLAARLAGNRHLIWGIRATELHSNGSAVTRYIRRACAHLSHWLPHTIVCAAEASRQLHARLGYDNSKMTVVANGFDLAHLVATPAQRDSLRRQCAIVPNNLVIGTLGRFNRDKDQENFVRAAGLLLQQFPNLHFLMVGRGLDGDNIELAHWINQTGHARNFILLGERDDIPACLAAMDLFCLSSRTEGFPNVVGEAMALGKPCVVTDVGDAAVLVGETGIVVPKEDAAALARGLASLLLFTPEERQARGRQARARIEQQFSIKRSRERFEAIYQAAGKREN